MGEGRPGYARSKNLTNVRRLTIASMIEKEIVVPRERRLVAAVIYNRLHQRMPLGIDATLRYGLDIPPTQAITKVQLASDSPYNTRKLRGLPPTPIANPGLASMQAAAHPAKVDYLYFVRKPDCRSHFFTAEHRRVPRLHAQRAHQLLSGQTTPRRPDRQPGRALALAGDAERRLRRARARLGLRAAARRGRAGRGRGPRASSRSASPGRT